MPHANYIDTVELWVGLQVTLPVCLLQLTILYIANLLTRWVLSYHGILRSTVIYKIVTMVHYHKILSVY